MLYEMKQILPLSYKHKKFNCGYTHKKFGLRMAARNSEPPESTSIHRSQDSDSTNLAPELAQQHQPDPINELPRAASRRKKQAKPLFRPYALAAHTTETRRKQQLQKLTVDGQQQLPSNNAASVSQRVSLSIQCQSITHTAEQQLPAHNHLTYTLMLQKQTQALYMRHILEQQGYCVGKMCVPYAAMSNVG